MGAAGDSAGARRVHGQPRAIGRILGSGTSALGRGRISPRGCPLTAGERPALHGTLRGQMAKRLVAIPRLPTFSEYSTLAKRVWFPLGPNGDEIRLVPAIAVKGSPLEVLYRAAHLVEHIAFVTTAGPWLGFCVEPHRLPIASRGSTLASFGCRPGLRATSSFRKLPCGCSLGWRRSRCSQCTAHSCGGCVSTAIPFAL